MTRDHVPKTTDAHGVIHYNAPHSELYSALHRHLRKRQQQISKVYSSRMSPREVLTFLRRAASSVAFDGRSINGSSRVGKRLDSRNMESGTYEDLESHMPLAGSVQLPTE